MTKTTDRRAQLHANIDQGEVLDQTPVELPAGIRHRKRTIAEEIQDQIAIQTARKHGQVLKMTPSQVRDELLDLEDEGESDPIYSQFEYTDMREELIDTTPEEFSAPHLDESELIDPPLSSQSESQPPPDNPATAAT